MKTILKKWWVIILILFIAIVLYVIGDGFISGFRLKEELNGSVFVYNNENDVDSALPIQIEFGKNNITLIYKMDIESDAIIQQRYYGMFKNPPGRQGTYYLYWLSGRLLNGDGAQLIIKNGEVEGLLYYSRTYSKIN